MPVTEKFKILNREASLISGLITNGLNDLRRVSKNQSFYYQSFYGLSIGLERLLKLLMFLKDPTVDLRALGHNIERLLLEAGFSFPGTSIEYKLVEFLNAFAKGNRYNIIDCLSSNDFTNIGEEPIVDFYNSVLREVINIHPVRKSSQFTNVDFASVFHIGEDSSEINDLNDLLSHGKLINHSTKYCVMYFGRLLQPLLTELATYDGPPDNPYFSEHFKYLRQDDNYFKNRKTYSS